MKINNQMSIEEIKSLLIGEYPFKYNQIQKDEKISVLVNKGSKIYITLNKDDGPYLAIEVDSKDVEQVSVIRRNVVESLTSLGYSTFG